MIKSVSLLQKLVRFEGYGMTKPEFVDLSIRAWLECEAFTLLAWLNLIRSWVYVWLDIWTEPDRDIEEFDYLDEDWIQIACVGSYHNIVAHMEHGGHCYDYEVLFVPEDWGTHGYFVAEFSTY